MINLKVEKSYNPILKTLPIPLLASDSALIGIQPRR